MSLTGRGRPRRTARACRSPHRIATVPESGARQFLHRIGAAEILPRETLNDGAGRALAGGRWAGCIDPVGGAGTAYALRAMRYGTAVATSGLTAGGGLHATVMPFILRAVTLIGIDSVHASTQARQEVWARLTTDLRPRGLDDTIAREVTLDAIRPALDKLLAGRSRGRTIVRLTGTTEPT